MQFNIKYLSLIMLLFVAFTSCKKEVDNFNLTNLDDKVVMQSHLCPQNDSIYVALTIAKGSYAQKKRITVADLKAASVTIEHNGIIKTIPFDTAIIEFLNNEEVGAIFVLPQNEMPIIPKEKYTLKVSNGNKFEATGSTTIPSGQFIDFGFTISDSIYDQEYHKFYQIMDFEIPDIKGENNYYIIGDYDGISGFYGNIYGASENLTDQNDAINTIKCSTRNYWRDYQQDSMYFVVSNISEDYYKFETSYRKAINNGENPFVEPSTVYSNVSGGFGVVGSMVLSMKRLK